MDTIDATRPTTAAAGRTALALVVLTVLAAGCGLLGSGASGRSITLPGESVFPEGVAVDPGSGDLFVGSTSDGTVFRIAAGQSEGEVFLDPGEGGRSAATGLTVDPAGELWVAGRGTGRAFVHDLRSGALLRSLSTPASERTLINDIALTPDAAYVTDSFRPVLWRAARSAGSSDEMEPWLDLTRTPIPVDTDFGLNGIVASEDGSTLLAVHFDTGRLFRIDVATKGVVEVDLGGGDLATGDGMSLEGRTLLVVRERPGGVVPVTLAADLGSGTVGPPFGTGFRLPTTIAVHDGEAYVVNSQLNAQDDPDLPFTVSVIPLPDEVISPPG